MEVYSHLISTCHFSFWWNRLKTFSLMSFSWIARIILIGSVQLLTDVPFSSKNLWHVWLFLTFSLQILSHSFHLFTNTLQPLRMIVIVKTLSPCHIYISPSFDSMIFVCSFLFYLFSFDFLVATLPCSYRQMFPNSIFCVITCCGGWWWLGRAQQQHAKECGIQTTRVRKLLVAAFDARTERGRLFGVWATTRQWTRQRIKRLPSPANALR